MSNVTRGIGRLNEELNSLAFISGLEAIIKHTSDTGHEAGFNVYYSKETDTLVYPDYFKTGDKNGLGIVPDFDLPENVPKPIREIWSKGESRRKSRQVEYPKTEDYERRKEQGHSTRENVCLISVHTHPSGDIFPSAWALPHNSIKS